MPTVNDDLYRLAELVRQACVQTALTAYEDARTDGLCPEGAWENAIDAMQQVDVKSFVRRLNNEQA
jgi:hypothetical protein